MRVATSGPASVLLALGTHMQSTNHPHLKHDTADLACQEPGVQVSETQFICRPCYKMLRAYSRPACTVQDQEEEDRMPGIDTIAKPAEPAGRELAAASASPQSPLDESRAGLNHMETLQAAAGGLKTHPESASNAMAPEQAKDAPAGEAEPVAAPSMDEADVVRRS